MREPPRETVIDCCGTYVASPYRAGTPNWPLSGNALGGQPHVWGNPWSKLPPDYHLRLQLLPEPF